MCPGFDEAGNPPYGVAAAGIGVASAPQMTGDFAVPAKVLLIGLMVLCGAASAASACQKKSNPLLDDNFRNADPGWGEPDNIASFTAQGLVMTPPVSGSAWRWDGNFTMEHADWCIEEINPTKLPDPADEDSVGAAGLWFWGKDMLNFYTATITLDGSASVNRLNGGVWQLVAAPVSSPAIKTAPGAANELEVVTNGSSAAFYVNGALIIQVTGHPPPGGGSPGIYAESGPAGTTWVFPRAILY